MKILIDIRLLNSKNFSGIGEYTLQGVKHILELDKKNEYILFANSFFKHDINIEIPKNAKIVNWRIPNIIFNLLNKFSLVPKIDTILKCDVLWSPHFNYLPVKNAKKIISIHDLSFLHYPQFFTIKQRIWHKMQNIEFQIKNADIIISNSQFTKKDIINTFKIREDKIFVIYPGISKTIQKISQNSPELIKFKEKYKIDYPFILFLGTIEPRKNIDLIIKAFNILKEDSLFKEFKLIIAGGRGWLYKKTIKTIKESSFGKDILLWGKIKEEEKSYLYNCSEYFIYPSFFEGFGFPPLEAQKCGKIAIISDRTSIAETSLAMPKINPWKPDELYRAIKQISENNNLRLKLEEEGIKNVSRFSWENFAKEMLSIFLNKNEV
ncbi:MAG: glycosyltransferase family 1 protein [Candidatus Pacebacteria bacterium]|nr:glycosyltransferase family 1 protein [Candidatus Paceibacterota bacterium]